LFQQPPNTVGSPAKLKLSGWQMAEKEMPAGSYNFPVRRKLLGRVTVLRPEPVFRRKLPVCG
jgi:hypothetical protein